MPTAKANTTSSKSTEATRRADRPGNVEFRNPKDQATAPLKPKDGLNGPPARPPQRPSSLSPCLLCRVKFLQPLSGEHEIVRGRRNGERKDRIQQHPLGHPDSLLRVDLGQECKEDRRNLAGGVDLAE